MTDYILTRASARLAGACYSDARLAELIPPEGLTVAQVAELPIPTEDIHYVTPRSKTWWKGLEWRGDHPTPRRHRSNPGDFCSKKKKGINKMETTYILTRASARLAGAHYSDARLAELIPPEGLTAAQVAALPIPPEDRHWALCYAMGLPETTLRLHAVWCARRALSRIESPDPRSIAACDTAERYALGQATDEELCAACSDSWAASWAANDAAWSAGNTAGSAAASAAVSLAWSPEDAAAWDAAKAAERAVQVLDLLERIVAWK